MGCQGILRFESGEDPKCMDAFAHAAAQRKIDFAQAQHLRRVDKAHVAGRAGGADRVGGPGDAKIERGLSGRVAKVDTILNNSFGMLGINSALIVKRFNP